MRLLDISVKAYPALKRIGHDDPECLVTAVHFIFVNNANNYMSLFAMDLEKLLVND